MKILALGDVCGEPGCRVIADRLWALRKQLSPDLIIVNGENATMRGISPQLADGLFDSGADVITLGNHAFANRKICGYLDDHARIIRPYNMPTQLPGEGWVLVDVCGKRVCVANLIGRVDMGYQNSSPFLAADQILDRVGADLFVFDFHASATSEKKAMGYHLDGRAACVFGTHTHVQTADGRVLPNGTGYITDLGMTGGQESVIGVKYEQSLALFRGDLAPRFESSDLDCRMQGALFTLDDGGRCVKVTPVDYF